MLSTLRFLAHTAGASLFTTDVSGGGGKCAETRGVRDHNTGLCVANNLNHRAYQALQELVKQLLLNGPERKFNNKQPLQKDLTAPLCIIAGEDTLREIGRCESEQIPPPEQLVAWRALVDRRGLVCTSRSHSMIQLSPLVPGISPQARPRAWEATTQSSARRNGWQSTRTRRMRMLSSTDFCKTSVKRWILQQGKLQLQHAQPVGGGCNLARRGLPALRRGRLPVGETVQHRDGPPPQPRGGPPHQNSRVPNALPGDREQRPPTAGHWCDPKTIVSGGEEEYTGNGNTSNQRSPLARLLQPAADDVSCVLHRHRNRVIVTAIIDRIERRCCGGGQ